MVEKKLNTRQLEAVRYEKGPLLIIAGAGTGKTTVITEKIKHIIFKNLAKPSEILALTFTEKAAREMEDRVDLAMPYGYTQMWISTFHSFCDRILRANALSIGIDPNYKLNTQAESVSFIRSSLFKFDLDYFRPLGNPTKFVGGMLQHFARLQDEDITPDQYLDWIESRLNKLSSKVPSEEKIENDKWKELAQAFRKYEELKIGKGVMDFGDLITKTLLLFRKRPNVLKEYRSQFKYVLVDEFQDTNVAQYELLKLLKPPSATSRLAVVGDDSQSIYKFRGAAISNILYFKRDYKKAKTVVLTKNYRSTQTILDSSYKLIRHNAPDTLEDKLGISKDLVSIKNAKKEAEISFLHLNRVENEAEEVVKEIKKLTGAHSQSNKKQKPSSDKNEQEKKYNYKDIAILVRANNHSEPFIRALQRNNVPYQFLGPGRLFKQPEIVDLIAYLKLLYNFDDSVSMYRLLSNDYFDISDKDLIRILNYAKKKNLSLYEACEKIVFDAVNNEVFASTESKEKIGNILEIVRKHQKLLKKETAGQLLYYFLESTGLIQKLLNPDTPDAEKRALNISKFFDKLKTYEVDNEDASVWAVVDWIDLASELGESPLAADIDWVDINAVNILTAHSSKGLEFSVVFLVNLVSQRFPTIERREQIPIPDELIKEVLPEGDYHIEEERRLFYVGMTRAKEKLCFTAADYYGEGKREKKLSPFIFEALGENATSFDEKASDEKQLSFLEYKSFLSNSVEQEKSIFDNFRVNYLSYSQIETFRICPLHFKLRYIYKLPTPATSSQSFGNSFHATMKSFYEKIISGEKPSTDLIYKTLKENWINEGYLGKDHEKSSFAKAKRFLKFYLDNYFDDKDRPVVLEQPFMVRLKDLNIGGKIDRVDLKGGILEVIDYKTGATPLTQKQANEDLQLSIYGLAATSIPEYPFNRRPEKVKLSLMYFDKPQIVTTTKSSEDLEKAKKIIEGYRKQIENSDFKCSGNILCERCEYKLFCQADEK